jgi:hypothetical protein
LTIWYNCDTCARKILNASPSPFRKYAKNTLNL